jgi:hypothetical protein
MPARKGQIGHSRGGKNKLPGMKRMRVVGGKDHKPRTPLKDAVSPEDDVFTPPHFLNVHGRQIWASAVRQLSLVGELSFDHIYGLTQLSHMWQRHMKKMEADQDIDWKEHEAFRKLLIEFGLTPAARQRMDPTGKGRVKQKRFSDEPDAETQRKDPEEGGKPANRFASLRRQVEAIAGEAQSAGQDQSTTATSEET